MENYNDVAFPKMTGPAVRFKNDEIWKQIQNDLNLLGPPFHDASGWRKVWSRYKSYVKQKERLSRSNLTTFTDLQKRVVELLKLEISGNCKNLRFNESVAGCSRQLTENVDLGKAAVDQIVGNRNPLGVHEVVAGTIQKLNENIEKINALCTVDQVVGNNNSLGAYERVAGGIQKSAENVESKNAILIQKLNENIKIINAKVQKNKK